MSATTLDFFTALGIDAQATDRDVRRAYARLLKAIDHETEVDAFHTLREHYQAALQWIAERDRQGVRQDPTPPGDIEAGELRSRANTDQNSVFDHAANTVVVRENVDAVEASGDPAQAVFDEFNAKLAAEIDSEAAAEAALSAALRDPRLSSIEAPAGFEARVAELLADGWEPGHQFLLLPAIQLFAWNQDFRRLETLGPVGTFLQAAVEQRTRFFSLPRQTFLTYAELIQRLRDDQDPTRWRLLEDMSKLRILETQFAEWLQVVTSMQNVRRWEELFDQMPESRQWVSEASPDDEKEARQHRGKWYWGGWLVWFFVIVLPTLKSCIGDLTR